MTAREGCEERSMEEKRRDCEQEFARIWNRLSQGDTRFDKQTETNQEHALKIENLQVNMANLIRSMSGLTKAIWGMVGSIVVTLIGFFIWYVQNIGRA